MSRRIIDALAQIKMPRGNGPAETNAKRVLVIDDDEHLLTALQRALRLRRKQWTVACFGNGQDGLMAMADEPFDAILCDMSMPGMHGSNVLKQIAQLHPDVFRIAFTGLADERWKWRDPHLAHAYLSKPCTPDEVIAAIEHPTGFVWALDTPRSSVSARPSTTPVAPQKPHMTSQGRDESDLDWG